MLPKQGPAIGLGSRNQQPRHPDDSNIFKAKRATTVIVCSTAPPITEGFVVEAEALAAASGWNDFTEDEEHPAEEEALRLISSGQSVFFNGFGGTGKTHAAKQAAKMLLEQGERVIHSLHPRGRAERQNRGRLQRHTAPLPSQVPAIQRLGDCRRGVPDTRRSLGCGHALDSLRCKIHCAWRLQVSIRSCLRPVAETVNQRRRGELRCL